MATLQELEDGLRKAHAAGNAEHARAFANAIREMRAKPAAVVDDFDPMRDLPIPGTSHPTAPDYRYKSMIPGGDALNAFSTAFGQNIPVLGPLATRAADATGSQIAAMITGESPEAMLEQGQELRARDLDDNHLASTAGAVAGSVGPLLALGTTKLGEQALGLTGPLWQRILAGGASGAAIAGLDAAARGEDLDEAGQQGLVGAGIGAAFPLAERALSPIARMLMGRSVPKSTQNLGRNLEREGIDPATLMQRIDDIGPDAVIADLGPNMQRQAGAIASLPGEGQTILRDALVRRQRGTNARIQGDVDASLGPATSPMAFNQRIRDAQRALSPQYERALEGASEVNVAPIADRISALEVEASGDIAAALRKVRSMLDDRSVSMPPSFGNAIDVQPPLISSPRQLLNVRHDLDDLVAAAQGNQKRILRDVRQMVDDELAARVPGIKDVDSQYQRLAMQREGFETGQRALDSGRTALTPFDLQAAASGATPDVLSAMTQGARAEIERIIGTTANNLTALKSALKGDGSWNRDRLVTLFGKDKADRLLDILEREQRYAQTFDTVTRNSETAARTAAQREAAPHQFGQTSTSVLDLALKIPQGLANMGARSRSEATNRAIAEMLMGKPTPEMVDQLLFARQMNRGLIGSSAVPMLTSP